MTQAKIITTHRGITVDSFAIDGAVIWFGGTACASGHVHPDDLDALIAALTAHRDARREIDQPITRRAA